MNDGSKDETLQVARELQKEYPEVVYIIDKENGGHGSTINAGIREARGKYFKVVDADDWVDSNNFENSYSFLHKTDVDESFRHIQMFMNRMGEKKKLTILKIVL